MKNTIEKTMNELRTDHRNMVQLLDLLDSETVRLLDSGEPDYDLVYDIMTYMSEYPDAVHHPKEDMIYRHIKSSHPDIDESLQLIETDHKALGEASSEIRRDIDAMGRDGAVSREALADSLRRYSESLRKHMYWEVLPGTINFEITETAVIRSVAEAGKLMSALREMGCQFALDDFGSGLSSFGHLKKLPVEHLKIDGMFIRDILKDKTNRIFVKSIIDIGHALGIKTVAEFVENEEILNVVRDLGADYAQGFEISRPFELAPQFPRLADSEVESFVLQEKAG